MKPISKWFMFLPQETESSSAGSQSSPSAPWDTTLNRALNVMKHKDKFSKPSSAGHVAGEGLSTKWSEYYKTRRKERKTSSESQSREVQELKAQVARIPEIVQEQVRDQLGATITAIMPSLLEGLRGWIAGGQQGPPRFPASRATTRTMRRHWCLRRRRRW